MYISAWEIQKRHIGLILSDAVGEDKIQDTDIVWTGPSGDAVIASDPAELDEQYADYTDAGQVDEYYCLE